MKFFLLATLLAILSLSFVYASGSQCDVGTNRDTTTVHQNDSGTPLTNNTHQNTTNTTNPTTNDTQTTTNTTQQNSTNTLGNNETQENQTELVPLSSHPPSDSNDDDTTRTVASFHAIATASDTTEVATPVNETPQEVTNAPITGAASGNAAHRNAFLVGIVIACIMVLAGYMWYRRPV
ncbi:hypothetical protein KW805_01565 [Candidatus Pacearchaeota archaeon]|nr:hypothetical protein [Candidatus Pacearchaeota archaeon]